MAEPVETNPCPGCGAKLAVEPMDLGKEVECPYCKTSFRALKVGGSAPLPPPAPPKMSELENTDDTGKPVKKRYEDDDAPRPSKRRRDDDDDGPVSSRKRRRRDEEDDDDYDDDVDDYDDDRPRIRRRREYQEHHRGGTVLTLGIFGCLCCQILSIVALIMGISDLGKMNRGQMDPSGKGSTITGIVFAGIGISFSVMWLILKIVAR